MRWGDILYSPAGTPDAIRGPWVRKRIADGRIASLQKIIDDFHKMLTEISWKWKAGYDRLKDDNRRLKKKVVYWRNIAICEKPRGSCRLCKTANCHGKSLYREESDVMI